MLQLFLDICFKAEIMQHSCLQTNESPLKCSLLSGIGLEISLFTLAAMKKKKSQICWT